MFASQEHINIIYREQTSSSTLSSCFNKRQRKEVNLDKFSCSRPDERTWEFQTVNLCYNAFKRRLTSIQKTIRTHWSL